MKTILNTRFDESTDILENAEKISSLSLHVENFNELTLDFYKQDENIWLKYNFIEPLNSHHLQFFARYAKDLFFKIPAENWELIEYATKTEQ